MQGESRKLFSLLKIYVELSAKASFQMSNGTSVERLLCLPYIIESCLLSVRVPGQSIAQFV